MPNRDERAADGCDAATDIHSLLLSLAGLVDDELLGWARELAAIGDRDYTLELVTATVAAEGIRLPVPVHARLRASLHRRPGMELPAAEPAPVMRHRFLADPVAAGYPPAIASTDLVRALQALPGRVLRGCRVRLSWRLTPAGSAPTPVPHPVLLVETTEHTGAEVLAYQISDLLGQAGVFASVEVFGPNIPVGDYHRAALHASVPLDDQDRPSAGAQRGAEPAAASTPSVESGPNPVHPNPVRPDPARTPTGTPVPAGGPVPRPPAGLAVDARASAPIRPAHDDAPFDWAPQEDDSLRSPRRPLEERDPSGSGPRPR